MLIVVLSVHAGFERDVKTDLLGLEPHIEVREASGFVEDRGPLEERLKGIDGVAGSYALIQDVVLVDAVGSRKPIFVRAIDAEDKGQIKALTSLLDKKNFPGSRADIGIDEYAVVSRQLANELYLKVGDTVEVYASRNFDAVKESFEETNVEPLSIRKKEEITAIEGEVKEFSHKAELPIAELQEFYGSYLALISENPREGEEEIVNGGLIAIESNIEKDEAAGIYRIDKNLWPELLSSLSNLKEFDYESADTESLKNLREFVLPVKFTVWGVYGDSQRTPGPHMFIPLPVGQEIKGLGTAVDAVAVRLDNPFFADRYEETLRKELGGDFMTITWMKRHETLFSLMRMEKVMLTFSMSLIGVISSFSIMAVMYTFAIQKKQEIGVMKALGATGSQISQVFVYQGLVVGFFGAVGGVLLALLILWQRGPIQDFIGLFGIQPFREEIHGRDTIPVRFLPGFMVTVAIAAWLLCGLAALLPARKAAKNDAAKSLRNIQ